MRLINWLYDAIERRRCWGCGRIRPLVWWRVQHPGKRLAGYSITVRMCRTCRAKRGEAA